MDLCFTPVALQLVALISVCLVCCPQAHPPIHPLKPYPGGDREKEALFEFIVRHFLA